VVAAAALVQAGEDAAQGDRADAPDRLGAQLQLALLTDQVALLGQLALQPAQGLDVVDGRPAEGPLDRLQVDVVQRGSRVALAERGLQRFEVSQLLQGRGGVAQAERLLPVHGRAPVPGQVGPARAQRAAEAVQLVLEPEVAEDRLGEGGQLGSLLGGEGGGQLLQAARVLGEHVAVALHELLELPLGVLPPGVGLQHGVEVGDHVPDALQLLRAGAGQGVAHPLELGVEHLAAEQVADLLVGGGGLGRAPPVVGQLADGPGGVRRELVELGLGQAGRVRGVGEQGLALGVDGLVEQLPDPLEGAVEPSPLAQLPAPVPGLAEQVAQAPGPGHALAQQAAQGVGGPVPGQDPLPQPVEGPGHVERRLQRVRPAPPGAVAVAHPP
jgi:hypothetical protein